MKQLDLTNYFNTTFLYKSITDINDNDLFTLYDYDRFPRKKLKNNDIEFDFSTIKDKCILANRQELKLNEKVDKIAIAGSSLLCAIKDKIKIIYEDDSYEYKIIRLDDYTYNINKTIKWMYGKQRKEHENFSIILNEDYNYKEEKLNFIYYDVIEVNDNKKIKSIILPNNELLMIFAITLVQKGDIMSYKEIIKYFDINIDKSVKEDNEYMFITNDENRLIYFSSPISKKSKKRLLSDNNIKLFEGSNFNVIDNKISYKKDNTNLLIEFNEHLKDYRYTTNGVVITSSVINGVISFDNESTFRCNDKNIVIIGYDNVPLLIINPLYNLSNSTYDKCYIAYKVIAKNKLFFEIKSKNQNEIHLEITMYSNKLIYDTIIEKSHKDRNNIYTQLAFFNYDDEVEELLLRINYLPLSNIINKNINKAYLYLPIIDSSEDVKLTSYKISSKWCSFNTTWNDSPYYEPVTNKIEVIDKYVRIDITDYIVNIANLNDIYNPGLVITCEKGQIILSTADSYYYPLILEVILDE